MTVAYITKANFKRIATYVSHSISGVKGIESLYTQELSRILAAPEMKLLSAVKLIVESVSDHEVLFRLIKFAEYYEPRERSRKDRWIYLGGAPAYHKKKDCAKLVSEYKNYDIPVEIPDNRIEEYRDFFLNSIELYGRNQAAFYAQVELKFNVLIQVKEVQADNTGDETVENYNLKAPRDLLIDISHHINSMLEFKESNDYTKEIIERLGFNTYKVMENPRACNLSSDGLVIIKKWHNLKRQLKDLVHSHLIAEYNPEFSFNGEMLSSFGFRACTTCHQ